MKIFLYGLVIVIFLYLSRNYIRGFILSKISKKKEQKMVSKDLIYTPIRSSRQFSFVIEIDEVGEGQAVISVVKSKKTD